MARILVVEDDTGQLEVRKLILEQSGHEVVTAQTAAEALDRLPGCQVVLMDLQLPRPEDGMQLINAASGAARIIVLSGGEPKKMPAVDAFLTKPCSSKKLLETIARFCLLLICLSVLHAATVKVSHPQSEVVAEFDLRGTPAEWSLATVFVDQRAQQQIMLYAGENKFTYNAFLGSLSAGEHYVDVRGPGVEFLGARFHEDSTDVVANAPVLFARANTVAKPSDIPLIVYCERLSENGTSFLQYTVIFSNEDGGTSTRALMARWGRTTDVEYVYRAFPGRATIQAKDHKEVEFRGHRAGSHPLLMPITDNNMIGEADASIPIRYQITPILVDLAGHSREEVIDEHPIAYEVMTQELRREAKLRPFGVVDGEKVSDPINYLYFEMKLAKRESFVATLVHLKGDPHWYSSHLGHADFAIRTWTRGAAESASGFVRTTVELPPGTRPDQISEIGFECIVGEKAASDSACRIEAVTKCFFLDRDYRPGSNVWTLTAPQEIAAGQIWTSALR
jgi:CheY-like chemotaxis protein